MFLNLFENFKTLEMNAGSASLAALVALRRVGR
jgi:hypothetical protein